MKQFLILILLFLASSLTAEGEQYTLEGGINPSIIPSPFSPDGTKIATYWRPAEGRSGDSPFPKSYLYIWNTANGNMISKFELDEYPSLIAWHPDSRMITAGRLSKSTLWKLPS